MHLGEENYRKHFENGDGFKKLLESNKNTRILTDEEKKVDSIITNLKAIKKTNSQSQALASYLHAVTKFSYNAGSELDTLKDLTQLGADMSEGVKGIGLTFYSFIDGMKTIRKQKEIQSKRNVERALRCSLKKLSFSEKRLFKLSQKTKEKFSQSHKPDSVSLEVKPGGEHSYFQQLEKMYSNLIKDLEKIKDPQKEDFINKLKNTIKIKELINNRILIQKGMEYDFLKSLTKQGIHFYEIDSDKIPIAVKKISQKIQDLKNEDHPLGHGVGTHIKELEATILKLQKIQIFDSMKKINQFKGKKHSFMMVFDAVKTISDVIGSTAMITMLAFPPAAPIGSMGFVSAVATRSTATLSQFIFEKFHFKKISKLQKNSNDIDKRKVEGAKRMLSELGDPIIPEKFPKIFQLFQNSIKNSGKEHALETSVEEKIIHQFERNLQNNISVDPQLKMEWENLKKEWEAIHKEIEVPISEAEQRNICRRYMETTAKFLMKEIQKIRPLEKSKSVDMLVDNLIEVKNMENLLALAGLQTISPSQFIIDTIHNHMEMNHHKYQIIAESASQLNSPDFLLKSFGKIKDLVEKGYSHEAAAMKVSRENEEKTEITVLKAMERQDRLNESKELRLLEDTLSKALQKFD
jgi:hypothetical protein